jgi:hypothetical protein
MNDDEVYQAGLHACRQATAFLNNATAALAELSDRLEVAQKEALEAGGVNDGWALEVDRLTHKLAQSTNYVADRECSPLRVTFNNGRVVRIVLDDCGNASLDVSMAE